jgi:hypothetical protein
LKPIKEEKMNLDGSDSSFISEKSELLENADDLGNLE